MTQRYFNHFAGLNLVYPAEQKEHYERFCQTGTRSSIDRSPFPRMVDLWFVGLSIAAGRKLKPVDLSRQKTSNFITGAIFDRDDWRVQAVMLAAIAVDDSVEVVGYPNRMMAIANGLAAAGVPIIVGMLQEGDQEDIWNLSEALAENL